MGRQANSTGGLPAHFLGRNAWFLIEMTLARSVKWNGLWLPFCSDSGRMPARFPASITVGAVMVLAAACGVRYSPEELWQTAQDALQRDEFEKAIATLESLTQAYPEHPMVPQAQFLLGDIYMNGSHDIARSIKTFQSVAQTFPETNEGSKALFMVGFLNANYLNDYGQARAAYETFLERYPGHELAPSVTFELDNLGKGVEEIEALKELMHGR